MSSVLTKTFQVAEQSLRDGKKACDKAETESRMHFLTVFHRWMVLERLDIVWSFFDFRFRFKSGTVTEKEKEEAEQK